MTALSRIKDNNPFISGLYGLLSQFMDLCSQLEALVEHNGSGTNMENADFSPERPRSSLLQNGEPISYGPQSRNFWDMQNSNDGADGGSSMAEDEYAGGLEALRPSMWDDHLMWELFNTQPSIGWFDVTQVAT